MKIGIGGPGAANAMRGITAGLLFGAAMLTACAGSAPRADPAALAQQVANAERGFAKTMADRDHAAFGTYLAEDAVFFSGAKPLRGRAEVAAAWKRFYERPDPPFSWAPGEVEVLDSGTLALSSGPVYDPRGKQVATFTSIWRLEAPGVWRIVFDKGNDVCDCAKP
jgi:ketosteroid isomerase-like protein